MDCRLKILLVKQEVFRIQKLLFRSVWQILVVHWDEKKNKATLRNQIIKDYPLPEPDIALRNVRWIHQGMILFCMVGPKNTYKFLRVVAKSVAEHLYQNQAINIAILKDQYILSGTGLTHGEWGISWRVQETVLIKRCFVA